MVARRQLHKAFDLLKCEQFETIVEKEGFASEKNLVLKECYLTLQQIGELDNGTLLKKVKKLEKIIIAHMTI